MGGAIGFGMASYQLALQQQAAFNELYTMQSIGALQPQSYYNSQAGFDVKFQEMKRDFEKHLKDWDKPVDNAI
jgi:hypothetical protein